MPGATRQLNALSRMRTGLLVGAVALASMPTSALGQSSDAIALGKAYQAYDKGDLASAAQLLDDVNDNNLVNRDYSLWLRGQVALLLGEAKQAQQHFAALADIADSRYRQIAQWRVADAMWQGNDRSAAAKLYRKLLKARDVDDIVDVPVILARLAELDGNNVRALTSLAETFPAHPLAAAALRDLAARGKPVQFSPTQTVERAKRMTLARQWDAAVAELESLPVAKLTKAERLQRDYWLGTTLYKMRRRYGEAGELLLGAAKQMDGGSAAEAMFHGARAMSRADKDDEAIKWYEQVVEQFPKSDWAKEAAYLTGWLEFNRGKYKAAIGPLEAALDRYPKSKWTDDSLWFLGMSHYLLGDFTQAKARLTALAAHGGALEGGKGMYWLSRTEQRLGNNDVAMEGFASLVKRFPLSWYAMLARARLKATGKPVDAFGNKKSSAAGPALDDKPSAALADDRLIVRADELIAANLLAEASYELARGEKGFLSRHPKASGYATLFDRYAKASNFNRPWMLSIVAATSALNSRPEGTAKGWWENAYPQAYQALIEKHQALGDNPPGYLYSIMRKESGFNPHDISYADAQGLLQMIPPTTKRVCKVLGLPYEEGRLYEPEFNIQTGSWYIGHMLTKFKKQIPIGAGSFNSGPRPVMKWLDQNGDREIDEFVELVPYLQTREYMKKVTENYARYRLLYANEDYEQPLTVDKHYVKNDINY